MEEFKKWVIALFMILVITAVIKYLIPNGKMKKVADIALSLLVLTVMMMPIAEHRNISSQLENSLDFFDEVEAADQSVTYNSSVKQTVENSLNNNKIKFNNVECETNIDSDGYIIINSITVFIKETDRSDEIKKIISDETGFDIDIITVR